jgi:hypothetical protein
MTSAASGSRKSIFATAGSIPTADFGQLSCGHNGEVPVLDHLRGAQKWLLLLLGAVALGLLPWTAYLTATLPRQHVAHHWDLAWAGFDVFEAVALAATMFALLRRLPQLPLLAAVAGTALLCDAWFDLLTASPGDDLRWSLVEAFVAELPLAALCFWIALDSDRALASAARASAAGLPPTVQPGRPAEGTERART